MPAVIRKDLLELRAYSLRHTFRTGILGEAVNNFYLKMMGVEEGTRNYDKMILLIYSWKYGAPAQ
jgi:hypothetical protein